jgi:hypothetical protein
VLFRSINVTDTFILRGEVYTYATSGDTLCSKEFMEDYVTDAVINGSANFGVDSVYNTLTIMDTLQFGTSANWIKKVSGQNKLSVKVNNSYEGFISKKTYSSYPQLEYFGLNYQGLAKGGVMTIFTNDTSLHTNLDSTIGLSRLAIMKLIQSSDKLVSSGTPLNNQIPYYLNPKLLAFSYRFTWNDTTFLLRGRNLNKPVLKIESDGSMAAPTGLYISSGFNKSLEIYNANNAITLTNPVYGIWMTDVGQYLLYATTDNNDTIRIDVDGNIKTTSLSGTGNAYVITNADGVLSRCDTCSSGGGGNGSDSLSLVSSQFNGDSMIVIKNGQLAWESTSTVTNISASNINTPDSIIIIPAFGTGIFPARREIDIIPNTIGTAYSIGSVTDSTFIYGKLNGVKVKLAYISDQWFINNYNSVLTVTCNGAIDLNSPIWIKFSTQLQTGTTTYQIISTYKKEKKR